MARSTVEYSRSVDPAKRQDIERKVAQARDQLTMHAEESQRLSKIEHEIQREHREYKDAFVSVQSASR
jgi:hypothetical protein